MDHPLLRLYDAWVLARPRLALAIAGALVLLAALGLPQLKLDASADALTLEHDEDLDFFRELNQRYGSSDVLVVTFRPRQGDLFDDANLALVRELGDLLAQVPGVARVQSIVNVPLLFSPKVDLAELGGPPRTLLDPDTDRAAARREFLTSPLYRELMLGPDGQTTGIFATLEGDPHYLELVRRRDALRRKRDQEGLSAAERAELERVSAEFVAVRTRTLEEDYRRVQRVRALIDGYRERAEVFLGGPTMITADILDYVRSDLVHFGAATAAFIVLALALIFRQLRFVVLPVLACALALVAMLGWLGWVDWRLTVISSNFPAILLIVSMAVVVHLIVRYRELHARHPDWVQRRLVRETVGSMFRPCLYTVLTTVVAFASLVVSDIRPVIDFGWMMTLGLLVSFVLVFVVIPAGLLVWGRGAVRHWPGEEHPHSERFARFADRHGRLVLAASAVLALVALFGSSRLEVDNRFIDYFRKDSEIYQGLSVIDRNLGGTTPLDIVLRYPAGEQAAAVGDAGAPAAADPFAVEEDPFALEGDPFASPEEAQAPVNPWFTRAGLARLERLQQFLEAMPEIGKVNSPVVAFQVGSLLVGHRLNDLELAFMRQNLAPEIRDFLLTPYLDDERREARFAMRTVETASNLKRSELIARIERFLREEMGLAPGEYRLSGLLVLYNNLLQSLYSSQILTLGAVLLGIALMFWALFRSLAVALVAVAPNVLAAGAVLGGMGLAGLPLDMMTITIAAITVGIGVDDTIHYVHRFREEFALDRDYRAAMFRAHRTIGRAMYYTSVIIVFGFAILTLSNFVPTILFGLLTGVAMVAALLGALLLLPLLIRLVKPFGPEAS
ncbi:MAG: membrane protein [Porticoccaceae bacterium]|nr:MAG: membrane protein [Porticoccaceae bacterium]